MNKWFKEIKSVGFKNWFWFVFILKRNEFHSNLNMYRYLKKYGKPRAFILLGEDRHKAHIIDMKLEDL